MTFFSKDDQFPKFDVQDSAASAATEVPTRESIAPEYKWRLEDIYASTADWEHDVEKIRALVKQFVGYAGHLGESAAKLLAAIRVMDELNEIFGRVYVYAHMRLDEDNADPARQELDQRAVQLSTEVYSQMAFFEPELLSIPEETINSFIKEDPGFADYDFYLKEVLRQRPHVLSIAEEQLLASASEVLHAPRNIFSMLNDADLRFPKVKDDEGREVELTHARYGALRQSRNRDVRRGAFEGLYTAYESHKNMLAATYSTNVKRDVFMAKTRHYKNSREMYMFGDNVPESVYDSLIEAVHASLPAMTRYMELRKRVLGLDDLHLYDLDVPIVGEVNIKIPYPEAVDTVLAAIRPLGEEYVSIAKEGLQSGWVDVYETRGKTSGAYSWGSYGTHPYILLNHQDTFDNMFTLAHELGHAMHTHYSHAGQPHIYADYTIFVAEVASTLNENLLMHHLTSTTDDKNMLAYVANHHLDTIRGTLIVQTLFAEFEKLAHQHVEEGNPLTLEWMTDICLKLNETYYGSVCAVDKQLGLLWSRIPHFYTPFYVYKYATGISAATALSERILKLGQPAADDYIGFLKSGGSNHPIELLRKAGVDMESPEPVKATLALFERLVTELESLIG